MTMTENRSKSYGAKSRSGGPAARPTIASAIEPANRTSSSRTLLWTAEAVSGRLNGERIRLGVCLAVGGLRQRVECFSHRLPARSPLHWVYPSLLHPVCRHYGACSPVWSRDEPSTPSPLVVGW